MPYDLSRLYTGLDEESAEFQRNSRTYNNSLGSHPLVPNFGDNPPSGIQLFFFDTDEELSKRLDASPRLCESTLKFSMNILGQNPYAKFFKGLRDLPNIEEQTIILNSNPRLDQHVYHLPSTSQNKELSLEQLHEELKTKTFIAEVKPGKQRDMATHQHYMLDYYLEEPEGESAVRKMTIGCSQQQKLGAVENLSMINQAPEQEVSSLRVRVCLENKFNVTKNAHEDTEESESDADDSKMTKREKLI
ncbi:hypothetical protein ACH5RR_006367 [Cinchona calisaya]|uniref:Uncharacterized protein n=1 Tax=Cinchona calisaya TaxID=153742 RepID=A0ABD3ANT5_9GENT